jgi:hypothetical protein
MMDSMAYVFLLNELEGGEREVKTNSPESGTLPKVSLNFHPPLDSRLVPLTPSAGCTLLAIARDDVE